MRLIIFVLLQFFVYAHAGVAMSTFSQSKKNNALKAVMCTENNEIFNELVSAIFNKIECIEIKGQDKMNCSAETSQGKKISFQTDAKNNSPSLKESVTFSYGRNASKSFKVNGSGGGIIPASGSAEEVEK